jgi:hypothetical protein
MAGGGRTTSTTPTSASSTEPTTRDGSASIRWRGENPSIVFWDSHASVEKIHGHNGATRIVWDIPLIIPPDLAAVQRRLADVIQGDIEHWDQGPLMEAVWASIGDIQPLIAEIASLRATHPRGY